MDVKPYLTRENKIQYRSCDQRLIMSKVCDTTHTLCETSVDTMLNITRYDALNVACVTVFFSGFGYRKLIHQYPYPTCLQFTTGIIKSQGIIMIWGNLIKISPCVMTENDLSNK